MSQKAFTLWFSIVSLWPTVFVLWTCHFACAEKCPRAVRERRIRRDTQGFQRDAFLRWTSRISKKRYRPHESAALQRIRLARD